MDGVRTSVLGFSIFRRAIISQILIVWKELEILCKICLFFFLDDVLRNSVKLPGLSIFLI